MHLPIHQSQPHLTKSICLSTQINPIYNPVYLPIHPPHESHLTQSICLYSQQTTQYYLFHLNQTEGKQGRTDECAESGSERVMEKESVVEVRCHSNDGI